MHQLRPKKKKKKKKRKQKKKKKKKKKKKRENKIISKPCITRGFKWRKGINFINRW